MIPFILALIFSTLFTLVLVLLGLFLFTGWLSIFGTNIYIENKEDKVAYYF